MAAKRTPKAAPAVESVEEDLTITEVDEDVDFDLDEDGAEEEAPAPKAKKKPAAKKAAAEKPAKVAAPKIEFGTKELAAHVNAEAGTTYDAYNLRILLRKLTKDGVLERVESEGRSRYSFTGPEDPQVVAIVEAVKSGAAEKAKQERLDKLKADRADKKAASPKKSSKKKAVVDAEPEADEEDDFEVDEEI
jgi:hypothetical protein